MANKRPKRELPSNIQQSGVPVNLVLTNDEIFRCLGFHEIKGLKLVKVYQTPIGMEFVVERVQSANRGPTISPPDRDAA